MTFPIEYCDNCQTTIQLDKRGVWRHIRSLEVDGSLAVQSPLLCNPGHSELRAVPPEHWKRWRPVE